MVNFDFIPCTFFITNLNLFTLFLNTLLTIYSVVTYLNFYSVIFVGIFLYHLFDVWFNHIWPEIRVPPKSDQELEELEVINPQLMTLDEFCQTAANLKKSSEFYLKNLLALRREKPFKFCLLICTVLNCTAFIGNLIRDLSLIMSITSIISLTPGIYLYLLPPVVKDYLKQAVHNINLVSQIAQQPSTPSTMATTSPIPVPPVETKQQEASSSSTSEKTTPSLLPSKSLLEHLNNNSFIARFYRDSVDLVTNIDPTLSTIRPNNDSILRSDSNAMDVPKNSSDTNQTERENQDAKKQGSTGKTTVVSDDMSTTDESASLVDLDEDQQDGFVML